MTAANLRRVLFEAKIKPRAKVFYAMLGLVAFVTALIIIRNPGQALFLPLTILVLYPLLMWIWLIINARSAANGGFSRRRSYTITIDESQATLTANIDDGSYEEFDITRPSRLLHKKNFNIVYISSLEMLYIPSDIFKTTQDRLAVEQYLIDHSRKVKR